LDDLSLMLEYCTCEGRLAAVIKSVRVSAMLEEQLDERSVAVVRRQHYLDGISDRKKSSQAPVKFRENMQSQPKVDQGKGVSESEDQTVDGPIGPRK
jgi:hypothetical protein